MSLFEKTGPLYRQYISREQAIREHLTLLVEREDAQKQLQTALAEKKQERAAKERERAAKEQERAAKEQERAAKERERAAKERERAAKEQERIEKEAVLRLLRENGIDPSEALASIRPKEPLSD